MEFDYLFDERGEKLSREGKLTEEEERLRYDYIRNIYNSSSRTNSKGDMGMKTRQSKSLEMRDLITRYNALCAELLEDGCQVFLKSNKKGMVIDFNVSKTINL